MRLRELSKLSGLSPSKARMYLVSFIRTGLIAQDELSGVYSPGPKALRLGLVALGQNRLVSSAREFVYSFGKETGYPVLLTAWDSMSPVIIESSESRDTLPIAFRLGTRTPLWTTATGEVFLAYLPEKTVQQAIAQDCPKGLERDIPKIAERVRRNGFAYADSVRITETATLNGYGALSLPVLSPEGRLESVITVLVPTVEDDESLKALAQQIREQVSHFSQSGG
jgi:DNA-binding IclR family transcriptional regulator